MNMMKRTIPFFILISFLACKKKDEQKPYIPSEPLTEQQQYELAINKIKNKKFILGYHYSAGGKWHLDTSTGQVTTIDSTVSNVFGDTLYFKYDSMASMKTKIMNGLNTLISSSEDSFFYNKIYSNYNNDKFIGLICPSTNCNPHSWLWHSSHDTTLGLKFTNYLNYSEEVTNGYYSLKGNEIQYYFDKDSIVLFHVYHFGGWPIEADIIRGFTVMYGKALN